ncbi:MAG: hydroxyacylglutathione hydrolase [Pelagibacteraceae bacterium]
MIIDIIPCLSDNYSYLINDKTSNLVGIVDPSDFDEVNKIIKRKYGKLDYILNTHHHSDHVAGNIELKKNYKSKIVGSKADGNRIPGIDILLDEGEIFKFGKVNFKIITVPGHTKGHIAFYSEDEKTIFTGDTLFSLGCGRVFEGTIKEMFLSINKIKSLPGDTKIYCGHEYTKQNLDFCLKFDENNQFLIKKLDWVKERNDNRMPTIPTTLEEEVKTNIFLRCDNSSIKNILNMNNSSDEQIFEKLRSLKDQF